MSGATPALRRRYSGKIGRILMRNVAVSKHSTPLKAVQDYELTAQDEIWAMRGLAIQHYADVEQHLCSLFALLTGMKIGVALIVFFKINNTRSAASILHSLMKNKHGDNYAVFWKSFMRSYERLTAVRNRIVHGDIAHVTYGDGSTVTGVIDSHHYSSDRRPPIDSAALLEFIKECRFFSRVCSTFIWWLDGSQRDQMQHLKDVFSRPLVYPPPEADPLSGIVNKPRVRVPTVVSVPRRRPKKA
jgi:hypothetical protein